MHRPEEPPKTSFRANLLSFRTLFIFAAGFGLALLLARTLPSASLFHPEGTIRTLDTTITSASVAAPGALLAIGTKEGKSFGTYDEMWDADLLRIVHENAPGPMSVPARIVYVVPHSGLEVPVSIRQPG